MPTLIGLERDPEQSYRQVPVFVPIDAGDGKKRWWRVSKTKAQDILLREAQAPAHYKQTVVKLILKLAAGEKLERHELHAIKLLQGFALLSMNRTQHQMYGYKIVGEVLEKLLYDEPTDLDDKTKQRQAEEAINHLGL